jgi:hypothetical protein
MQWLCPQHKNGSLVPDCPPQIYKDAMTIDNENEAAHAAQPMVTRGLLKATRVTNRDVDVIMSGHYYIPSSSWSFTN